MSGRGETGSRRKLLTLLRARVAPIALGFAAAVVVTLFWASNWVGGEWAERFRGSIVAAEGVVFDYQMRWRGERPPHHPDVVVVAVDDASIDCYGRWPWPRPLIASLLDRLTEAGAKVIALDMIFSEPTPEDPVLQAALERAERPVLGFFSRSEAPTPCLAGEGECPSRAWNVDSLPILDVLSAQEALVSQVTRAGDVETNLDSFERSVERQGFYTQARQLGVQRTYDLVARAPHADAEDASDGSAKLYVSLALRAVRAQMSGGSGGEPNLEVDSRGTSPVLLLDDEPIAADQGLGLTIDYAGNSARCPRHGSARRQARRDGSTGAAAACTLTHYPIYPACSVLTGEATEFGDKLVFVGISAASVGDFVATPFGQMAGVEVHANVAGNLLSGRYLFDAEREKFLSLIAVFALGLLVAWLVSTIARHWLGALAALSAVAGWFLLCHWVLVAQNVHLWAVPPILAGVLSLVLTLPYQLFVVEGRSRRVRSLFHHYLAPAIIEQLLERDAIELRSEQQELSVLFSDIRGFTDLSEGKSPQEVVEVLNEFFTPMTRIVLDAGGTLDKYMGDAMMAFFGAPVKQDDHAARACRAALAMRRALAEINERWRQEGRMGEGRPGLGIGIGVNSGEMTVGNMGSEEVFDYTVIGDAVNLGSRIESLNKVYRTEALVSEATKKAAGDGFLFRELDRVRVKGKSEAVAIFELMAAAEAAPEGDRRLAERFAAALALYRGRNFAEAEAAFAELAAEGDGPAELFLERCRRYRAEPPPEGWDGVETFTSK